MRQGMYALASAAISLAIGADSGASVRSQWNLVSAGSVTTTCEVDGSALVGGSILWNFENASTLLVNNNLNGAVLAT